MISPTILLFDSTVFLTRVTICLTLESLDSFLHPPTPSHPLSSPFSNCIHRGSQAANPTEFPTVWISLVAHLRCYLTQSFFPPCTHTWRLARTRVCCRSEKASRWLVYFLLRLMTSPTRFLGDAKSRWQPLTGVAISLGVISLFT